MSNKENNIVFIATYEDLAKKAREVAKNLEVDVEIIYAKDIAESLSHVDRVLESTNIDVIISRGGVALKLREEYNIPVIEIEVTVLDIIRSIERARKHGKRIGVIGFPNIISNISNLSSYLNLEIYEISINSISQCPEAVRKALELGADSIVGDRIAVETAQRFGMRGEFIESDSRECITDALFRAIEISEIRLKQLKHLEEKNIITELTQSGIIVVDRSGIINLVNAEASRILEMGADEAMNKNIGSVISDFDFTNVIEEGRKINNEIVCANGNYIFAHIIPIIINSVSHGAVITFQRVDEIQKLEIKARNRLAQRGHVARFTFDSVIGESESIKKVIEKAKKYSRVDSAILINGSTGTGKEVIAQSIHNHSKRSNKPFVSVNCAALPLSLLESELFGYVKGAFTGARKEGKIGLFEQAHEGTIFLDEIGEIPMEVQARLLRVVQEGQIQKIGDDRIITVDTRIISATNKDLMQLVNENKFREDLFYRINVLNINMPDLNKRAEDIPIFVKHFLKQKSLMYNKSMCSIDDKVIETMANLVLPGNIRQLENVVERLVVECEGGKICIDKLNSVLDSGIISGGYRKNFMVDEEIFEDESEIDTLDLDLITKNTIERALAETNTKSEAANMLGIDRSTLWRKMKSYGIE